MTEPLVFNMTLLGSALLAALRASGRYAVVPFEDPETRGAAIEVYPGLTMRSLGWRAYKGDPAGAIGLLLDFCARHGLSITLDPAIRRACETYRTQTGPNADPDASDALIALATAILYREGLAGEVIPPGQDSLRTVEGAVWGPIVGG